MSITVNDRRYEYPGNDVATVFPGPKVFSADQLGVWSVDPDLQVATELTGGGVDYTLSRLGMPSSTVTMTVAPATGTVLLLLRTLPLEQRTRFRNQGAFLPELHEDALDEGVMIDQQLQDQLDRVLKGGETQVGDDWNFDAMGRRIINLGDGIAEKDAVNLGQMRIEIEAVLSGGPTYGVMPRYWEFNGDGVQTDFTLSGAELAAPEFYDVFYNRVPQEPYDDYSLVIVPGGPDGQRDPVRHPSGQWADRLGGAARVRAPVHLRRPGDRRHAARLPEDQAGRRGRRRVHPQPHRPRPVGAGDGRRPRDQRRGGDGHPAREHGRHHAGLGERGLLLADARSALARSRWSWTSGCRPSSVQKATCRSRARRISTVTLRCVDADTDQWAASGDMAVDGAERGRNASTARWCPSPSTRSPARPAC